MHEATLWAEETDKKILQTHHKFRPTLAATLEFAKTAPALPSPLHPGPMSQAGAVKQVLKAEILFILAWSRRIPRPKVKQSVSVRGMALPLHMKSSESLPS